MTSKNGFRKRNRSGVVQYPFCGSVLPRLEAGSEYVPQTSQCLKSLLLTLFHQCRELRAYAARMLYLAENRARFSRVAKSFVSSVPILKSVGYNPMAQQVFK